MKNYLIFYFCIFLLLCTTTIQAQNFLINTSENSFERLKIGQKKSYKIINFNFQTFSQNIKSISKNYSNDDSSNKQRRNRKPKIHSCFAAGLSIPKWNVHINGLLDNPNVNEKIFIELYISLFSPFGGDNYYDDISQEAFNDPSVKESNSWIGFNFGLGRNLSSNILGYLGIGLAHKTALIQLEDPSTILGDNEGLYWVENEEKSGMALNFTTGIYLRNNKKGLFHIGYNHQPSSIVLGYGMVLY